MSGTDVITYLVIKPDGSITRKDGTMAVRDAQAIVAGDFEALPTPAQHDVTVLVNKDAKAIGLEPNWTATSLVRSRLRPDDFVAGTVIVAGLPDDDGELTSIPDGEEASIRRLAEL